MVLYLVVYNFNIIYILPLAFFWEFTIIKL